MAPTRKVADIRTSIRSNYSEHQRLNLSGNRKKLEELETAVLAWVADKTPIPDHFFKVAHRGGNTTTKKVDCRVPLKAQLDEYSNEFAGEIDGRTFKKSGSFVVLQERITRIEEEAWTQDDLCIAKGSPKNKDGPSYAELRDMLRVINEEHKLALKCSGTDADLRRRVDCINSKNPHKKGLTKEDFRMKGSRIYKGKDLVAA